MADLDFGKIKIFVGNYDFWKQSSELAAQFTSRSKCQKQKKKSKNYKNLLPVFSANASKSKQATSRKKMLDKIELEEIIPSSRKYPFINFKSEREIGNDLPNSWKLKGCHRWWNDSWQYQLYLTSRWQDCSYWSKRTSKQLLSFVRLWAILNIEGTVKWGVTTSQSYLPKDNTRDFDTNKSILDWLRQFASKEEDDNTFLRSFLGRMLFSGDEVNKPVNVLSGAKKYVWCCQNSCSLNQTYWS